MRNITTRIIMSYDSFDENKPPVYRVEFYCPYDLLHHGEVINSWGNLDTAEHYARKYGFYDPKLNLLFK